MQDEILCSLETEYSYQLTPPLLLKEAYIFSHLPEEEVWSKSNMPTLVWLQCSNDDHTGLSTPTSCQN